MATGTQAYDNGTPAPTNGRLAVATIHDRGIVVIPKVMDAAAIIAAAAGTGLASASKITAGEEITAIWVPEGFLVFGATCTILEAGDASATINIGTLANTTAFDGSVDIAAAVGTRTNSATDAGAIASGGTFCTAATAICVEYIADTTTGKFLLQVYGLDTGNKLLDL